MSSFFCLLYLINEIIFSKFGKKHKQISAWGFLESVEKKLIRNKIFNA